MPAQAGIQSLGVAFAGETIWILAFAGMTGFGDGSL